jgi:hypothetical protein
MHEVAARAACGKVAMVYFGDGAELAVAVAGGSHSLQIPPGAQPTRRWLALEGSPVRVARDGAPSLEFDVVQRRDGTPALDVFDWMGFEGLLFERDEVLYLETLGGALFEFAAADGSVRVLAHPNTDLVVVVEVVGASDAFEVAVRSLFVSSDATRYAEPSWRVRSSRRLRFRWRAGVGPVALEAGLGPLEGSEHGAA